MEKEISYQKYFPNNFKPQKGIGNFFINEKDDNFLYSYNFLPRHEILISKVKGELLKLINQPDQNLYSFSKNQNLPHHWKNIISFLKTGGFIDYLGIGSPFNDEIKLFFLDIFSPLPAKLTDGLTPKRDGYSRGVSSNLDEAVSKAIGEFLERYSLLMYRKRQFVKASINQLKNKQCDFLDIHDLAGFSEKQKIMNSNLLFDNDSQFYWVEGGELNKKSKTYIPAQLIFWNYDFNHGNFLEPHLRESNTSGGAGFFTFEGAMLSAVYENVQRDAFFIHWLNGNSPKQILNSTITSKKVQRLLDQARRYNFEVVFLNTASDIKIPSCVCILLDRSGVGPAVSMGGGCGFNPDSVLERALTEACSIHHWLRKRDASKYVPLSHYVETNSIDTIGQDERLRMWSSMEMLSELDFFLKGGTETFDDFAAAKKSFSSDKEALKYVAEIFRKLGKGYEIYYFNAKNDLLKTLGYYSVKVVIPKLIPLYLNERNTISGAERINKFSFKIGSNLLPTLNTVPHPFP